MNFQVHAAHGRRRRRAGSVTVLEGESVLVSRRALPGRAVETSSIDDAAILCLRHPSPARSTAQPRDLVFQGMAHSHRAGADSDETGLLKRRFANGIARSRRLGIALMLLGIAATTVAFLEIQPMSAAARGSDASGAGSLAVLSQATPMGAAAETGQGGRT